MNAITDSMNDFAISSTTSSMSTRSTPPANTSSDSSRKPSSATSISPATSQTAIQTGKHSRAAAIVPSSASQESVADDFTQGQIRALRRQALARRISTHLGSLPLSPSSHSLSSPATEDKRLAYLDALISRDPDTYTPAVAAYYADHPDAIPERPEDSATRRRKRYDACETVTDRHGRTTRVDGRQYRLFHGWEWTAAASSPASNSKNSARNADYLGPKGERERGDEVRCTHCERKQRRGEVRRVAIKGLNKLIGRSGSGKEKRGVTAAATAGLRSAMSEKTTAKAIVEAEAEHAEQVERVLDSHVSSPISAM